MEWAVWLAARVGLVQESVEAICDAAERLWLDETRQLLLEEAREWDGERSAQTAEHFEALAEEVDTCVHRSWVFVTIAETIADYCNGENVEIIAGELHDAASLCKREDVDRHITFEKVEAAVMEAIG